MARENIDAVLFTSYHNINYYADFLYCSFGRKYGLVVTPKKVVSISANIDGGQPWRRTVGDYNVVYTDWQRDNFFRAVQGEIENKGRVGVEFDQLPVDVLAKLKAALPSVRIRRYRRADDAHAHDQVGGGNRGHQARRECVRCRRRGACGGGARRRARARSGACLDAGDGARDRPPLSRIRN